MEEWILFFVRCRIALIIAEIVYLFGPQLEAFIASRGYRRNLASNGLQGL